MIGEGGVIDTFGEAVLTGACLGLLFIGTVIGVTHRHFWGHWRFWINKRKDEL